MVIGETEIFGQLKNAYELAFTHKHTGARLNKAFQRAFNVAKHIRTETNIQRGSVSVMSAAVELAEKIFSSLAEHEVLVIGAGETSEKTARALQSRGVQKNHRHQPFARTRRRAGGRTGRHAPCRLSNGRRSLSGLTSPSAAPPRRSPSWTAPGWSR